MAWDTAKTALSIAALFGCAACGGAALVMSAIDFGLAAKEGDVKGMATNAIDFIPIAGKASYMLRAERQISRISHAKSAYKALSSAEKKAFGSRQAYIRTVKKRASVPKLQEKGRTFEARANGYVTPLGVLLYAKTYGNPYSHRRG